MREKILAELRKQFAGLPERLLGQYADKLTAKVTEESAIEGAVSELNNLPFSLKDQAALLQSEGDRRVQEALKKKESESKPDPKKDPATELPPDTPEWAKGLLQQNQQLQERLNRFEQSQTRSTLQERYAAKLAEKKIPAVFGKGRVIEKEEDIDAILAEVEADYTAYQQEVSNDGLGQQGAPKGGQVGGDAKSVAADITAHFGTSEVK